MAPILLVSFLDPCRDIDLEKGMSKGLKKVLIVDDEETLTWSMAKSLSKDKDKYEVMIANLSLIHI